MTERKSGGVTPGIVSLVVIFVVLAVSVFAVLSLVTAQNEYMLAEATAKGVEQYYAAEYAASDVAVQAKLRFAGGQPLGQIASELGLQFKDGTLCGSFPVGDKQALEIALADKGGALEITVWQLVRTADWSPDDNIEVWEG